MRVRFSAVVMAINLILSAPADAQLLDAHTVARGSWPAIAAGGEGRLYATFEAYENDAKVPDIFFSISTNGGATWSPAKDISRTLTGVSRHPDIAVEKNGAVDVVWSDSSTDPTNPDIFFVRSADGGKSWTEPMDISNTPGVCAEPSLAIGPHDSIHVVWSDTSTGVRNRDIYYVCSKDGGRKWAKDQLLPAVDISSTPGSSSEPSIAVGAEGIVHVAWADTTAGATHPDIYYVWRENNAWTKPVNVSKSVRISSHPTLACDKGKVFLAWSDNSKKETAADIWLAVADRPGKFANTVNISETKGVSIEPSVAADDGLLTVVWSDTTASARSLSADAKTASIFARLSPDSASNFSKVISVSNPQQMAIHPHATFAGGKMIVIWEELDRAGEESTIKASSITIKGLATSTAAPVTPTVHRAVTGNQH